MKLHRLTMSDLYSGWAPPSTWLHSPSPHTACKAATLAAWSHAVKVCCLLRVCVHTGIPSDPLVPHGLAHKGMLSACRF